MELKTFSKKQQKVLSWFKHPTYSLYNGVIADGAIRSGKTLSMTFAFILWSMSSFNDTKFAITGATIHSVDKNIVKDFIELCKMLGFNVKHNRSQNKILVASEIAQNEYFIYGGGNEQSQDLIQGMTLGGVLFDEVALQKESFVNQATGRCSVTGSKYWFNCNPDAPNHWFKKTWIDEKDDKKLLYLHFDMNDNLSLTEEIKERYRSQYAGIFYDRYILGQWTAGHGAIYDMFGPSCMIQEDEDIPKGRHYVSIDYGTKNPMAFLRIINTSKCSYVIDEYYYNGRKEDKQKTDAEYRQDLVEFCNKNERPWEVIIDPSAASFKVEVKQNGKLITRDADNAVLDGIRLVASLLQSGRLKIHPNCKNLIEELHSYRWKDTKGGKEEPEKENDHALDALRYYCKTIVKK